MWRVSKSTKHVKRIGSTFSRTKTKFEPGVLSVLKQLLSILLAITAGTGNASSAEIPAAAFKAWAYYRSSLAQRGFVIEQRGTQNGEEHLVVYRWSSSGGSLETDLQAVADGGLVAFVRNRDYAFQVAKDGNRPWALRELLLETVDIKTPKSKVALLTRDEAMPAFWGLTVDSVLLPDAIDDGLITVESVRETYHQGMRTFEVTIRGDPKRQFGFQVHRGTLKLAPDYLWMITEARLELASDKGNKGTSLSERRYTTDISNFTSETMLTVPAVISEMRTTETWETMEPVVQELQLHWKLEVPQESEFRLGHYGLSERHYGVPEPRTIKDQNR